MIKKFFLMFALSIIFTIQSPVQAMGQTTPSGTIYGKVVRVVDGNAFVFQTVNKENYTIQIAGVDTSSNPDAYKFLTSFLQGKNISVEFYPVANNKPYCYGVVLYNKMDIGYQMLYSGIGEYSSNTILSNYKSEYSKAQNIAKNKKVGIWRK